MSLRGLLEEGVKGDDKSYVNNAEIVQWAKFRQASTKNPHSVYKYILISYGFLVLLFLW